MRIILPGIAMIGVTYAFARYSFALYLPNISVSIGITEAEAGIASSAAYIAYTLALLTSSYLIRKFNEKRVIQLAGITAILGLIGIAFSYNLYLLICSTFIAGLGSGWASPAYSQVVKNSFNIKDADRGNTWINTGTSFGLILSGPVALLFIEQWRLAFLLFAFISVLVLIWNTIRLPFKENSFSEQRLFKQSVLKNAKFLLMASLIIGFGSSIFWTFSRNHLQVSHNMSTIESVSFWVLMGVSGIAGGVAGRMILKLGLSHAYRIILICMSVAIALITIPNMPTIYLSAILFGISYIFLTGILIVWATRIFKDMPSIGVSLAFLSLGVGQSMGSAIGGEMINVTSYSFSFILYAAISLIGLLVPTKQKVA